MPMSQADAFVSKWMFVSLNGSLAEPEVAAAARAAAANIFSNPFMTLLPWIAIYRAGLPQHRSFAGIRRGTVQTPSISSRAPTECSTELLQATCLHRVVHAVHR